jgi:poly-gamma-glutamate synthesis protein (capsule biosynthesis protein)
LLPTLRLPFDYLRPSISGLERAARGPLEAELRPAVAGPRVTVVLVGDLMRTRRGEVPRVDPRLRRVVGGADLVVGNCEGPVSGEPERRRLTLKERLHPRFLVDLLAELGADPRRTVLSVANNHSGDHGREGLDETVELLTGLGVTVAGLATAPIATARAGELEVGVVAWTTWMNREAFAPGSGVARERQIAAEDWGELRRLGRLDTLVAFPHWGWELRHVPGREVLERVDRLLEQGFDLVAGHHPHVLHPVEVRDGRLVASSLGNLTGPSIPMSWPMRLGALLEVTLGTAGEERGRVLRYRLHPCVQPPGRPARLLPLDAAAEPLRRRAERRLALLFPAPAAVPLSPPPLTLSRVVRSPLPHLAGEARARLICRGVAAVSLRFVLEVENPERVAVEHDPFILALNHTTRLEAVLVPGRLILLRGGRRIHFMADWNLLLVPLVASIYRASGVIVVARKRARPRILTPLRRLFDPGEDAFLRARRVLETGNSVGIYPEARMNRDPERLLRGQRGVARLALETGAPVVPGGIVFPGLAPGQRIGDLTPMRVRLGAPLEVERLEDPPNTAVDALHRRIMRAISQLSGKAWYPAARRV